VSLDRLLVVTAAVRREAIRRDAGERRDPRFDTPIAVLLDLADELSTPIPADVDAQVEELHAGRYGDSERGLLDDCTCDDTCEASLHLASCPRHR